MPLRVHTQLRDYPAYMLCRTTRWLRHRVAAGYAPIGIETPDRALRACILFRATAPFGSTLPPVRDPRAPPSHSRRPLPGGVELPVYRNDQLLRMWPGRS